MSNTTFIVAALVPLAVLAATPTMTAPAAPVGNGPNHLRGGASQEVDQTPLAARRRPAKNTDRRTIRQRIRQIRPTRAIDPDLVPFV